MNALAWQDMTDHFFRHPANFDELVEVDTGGDAHFLAEQDEFLSADIAGCTFLSGKWASAQSANSRVETGDAKPQSGVGVSNGQATSVVEV